MENFLLGFLCALGAAMFLCALLDSLWDDDDLGDDWG